MTWQVVILMVLAVAIMVALSIAYINGDDGPNND